jgi:capsular exopolysaccharide synthesis family protein
VSDYIPTEREQRGAVRYVQAIRAHWKLIALLVGLATAASIAFLALTPKQFEATADIILSPVPSNDETLQGLSIFRQSVDGSPSVVTAARVFNSAQTRLPADAALRRAGLTATVVAEPLAQADIVSIRATSDSARNAAHAANLFAETTVSTRSTIFQQELRDRIRRLGLRASAIPAAQRDTNVEYAAIAQRLGELQGYVGAADPTLRIAARATPPAAASWPRPALTLVAAIVAALLLGVGIALLLEVANPRISRENDLQLSLRSPILARIPRFSTKVAHGYLLGQGQLPGGAWKGYRTLRASLATAGPDGEYPRSILVTSASPGDGKTMTAANLAITLAAADMRVVLVDADLLRPMIATIFNVRGPQRGFVSVLARRAPLETSLVQAGKHPRLKLLLSQPELGAHVRLFDAAHLRRAVEKLHEVADVVVFDSPPLTEVAEALELAASVDAVILAVRLGHTRRDRLADLREMLVRRGVSPVGLVVTTRERPASEGAYDYQGEVVRSTLGAEETPQPQAVKL